MLSPLAASLASLFLIPAPQSVDVPLRLYKNATWPNGVNFGNTAGISVGDYDGDGWVDVFACQSAHLWRNVGGVDWELVADLKDALPFAAHRYGSVIADYDDDGLADIGTEPRVLGGDACFHLLHNLGDAIFVDVAGDPAILDVQPCNSPGETWCVADVDGDRDLDWFLPVYPPWIEDGPGNWFLENLGPTGPGGAFRFHEASFEAGLDNPAGSLRPEGAMFVDLDLDGDLDLYCNHVIYQNRSTAGVPRFGALHSDVSGLGFPFVFEEGAAFLDYDMDGDFDLFMAYCDFDGARLHENRGDGTLFLAGYDVLDDPISGICLGMSAEDWDNDGDVDVTTREVFRRNMLMEEGRRHFTVATHSIDAAHVSEATPAWFDFDRDGDLDTALGNWRKVGLLYENELYDASTPDDQRRYVRVKPVRDHPIVDRGLESEFGAMVEIRIASATPDRFVRRKVVSSSAGYLNQSEYALHFALPADPDPADPLADLRFEVIVDFPGHSGEGLLRIDRTVNPVLGSLNPALLRDREIVVYRSGRVRIDGCDFALSEPAVPLRTTTGGLALADDSGPLPDLVPAPAAGWYAGIELTTKSDARRQRVTELVVDGTLEASTSCHGEFGNAFAWDVTDPAAPVLVPGSITRAIRRDRNHRHHVPVDFVLEPGRVYRVVVAVNAVRGSPIAAPHATGPIEVTGGLGFADADPCSGVAVAHAPLDPAQVPLALRFRPLPRTPWRDLGHALAGTQGEPTLTGSGELAGGTQVTLTVESARPNAPTLLIASPSLECLPFAGGVIVPRLEVLIAGLTTDASGALTLTGAWPSGIPGDLTTYWQVFLLDPLGPKGFAATNALAGTTRD